MICPFCTGEFADGSGRCEHCGFVPLPENSGIDIAGYTILGEIGRGGAGVVYLAIQKSLDRPLALKMLPLDSVKDEAAADDFFREARTAARLDHPNIVGMIEAGRSFGGNCFFSMELVRGITGEDLLRKSGGRIGFERTLDIAVAVADALDYGYREFSLTHGDIKPSNLLIRSSDGAVKLADFGLARFGQEQRDGDVIATPMYAAPEIVRDGHAGFGLKADMYAFGIMLYEMVSGCAPFVGEPDAILQAHLTQDIVPLKKVAPSCNPDFSGLVSWLTAKDPGERPASWRAVLDCLKMIRRSLEEGAAPVHHRISPLGYIIAGAAVLVLAAAIAGPFIYLSVSSRRAAPPPPSAPLLAPAEMPDDDDGALPVSASPAPVAVSPSAVPASQPEKPQSEPVRIAPAQPENPVAVSTGNAARTDAGVRAAPAGDLQSTALKPSPPVTVPVVPAPRPVSPWRVPKGTPLKYPALTLYSSRKPAAAPEEAPEIIAAAANAVRNARLLLILRELDKRKAPEATAPYIRELSTGQRESLELLLRLMPKGGLSKAGTNMDEVYRNYLIFNSGDFEKTAPRLIDPPPGAKVSIARIDTVGITVAVEPRSGRSYRQTLNWVLFQDDVLRRFVTDTLKLRARPADENLKQLFICALKGGDVETAALIAGRFGKSGDTAAVAALAAGLKAASGADPELLKSCCAPGTGVAALRELFAADSALAATLLSPEEMTLFSSYGRKLTVASPDSSRDAAALRGNHPDYAAYVGQVRYAQPHDPENLPEFEAKPCGGAAAFFGASKRGSFEYPSLNITPDAGAWERSALDAPEDAAPGIVCDPEADVQLQAVQSYLRGMISRKLQQGRVLGLSQRFLSGMRRSRDRETRVLLAAWELENRRAASAVAMLEWLRLDQSPAVASVIALRALLLPQSGGRAEEAATLLAVLEKSPDAAAAKAASALYGGRPVSAEALAAVPGTGSPSQWAQLMLELDSRNILSGGEGMSQEALEMLRPSSDSSSVLAPQARLWLLRNFSSAKSPAELADLAAAATADPSYAMSGAYDEIVFAAVTAQVLNGELDTEGALAQLTRLLVPYGDGGKAIAVRLTRLLRLSGVSGEEFLAAGRGDFVGVEPLFALLLLKAALDRDPETALEQLKGLPLNAVEQLYAVKILSLIERK